MAFRGYDLDGEFPSNHPLVSQLTTDSDIAHFPLVLPTNFGWTRWSAVPDQAAGLLRTTEKEKLHLPHQRQPLEASVV
jgi:hypothetical protein